MSQIKVTWHKFAEQYDLYRSVFPGSAYEKIATTENEFYDVEKEFRITGLDILNINESVLLSWDKSQIGVPEIYKVLPSGAPPPSLDYVWMGSTLPYGANWINMAGATWSSNCIYGSLSLKVEAEPDSFVYPQISGANYPMNRRYIIVWAYIDPQNIPDEIMISFFDGTWHHRVYWGESVLSYGTEGTSSKLHKGSVFPAGVWTPLIIDKKILNCEDISGIGIAVRKRKNAKSPAQKGVLYINSIANTDEIPYIASPHLSLSFYRVYRKRAGEDFFSYIGNSKENSFIDKEAFDSLSYSSKKGPPIYSFSPSDTGDSITISWTIPKGAGTEYIYKVFAQDGKGINHEPSLVSTSVSTDYSKVVIYSGLSIDSLEFITEEPSGRFTHSSLSPETTYFYKFDTYSSSGEITSSVIKSTKTKAGSNLDSFILDMSVLA